MHQEILKGSTEGLVVSREFINVAFLEWSVEYALTFDALSLASNAFFFSRAALALSRTAFASTAVTGFAGAVPMAAADDATCPLLVSNRVRLAAGCSGSAMLLQPMPSPASL